MERNSSPPTLYDSRFEQDSCGVGFIARPSVEPSHDIIEMALAAVVNLAHRGALDADAKTGDGSGILTQIPRRLLVREVERLGIRVSNPAELAIGVVFCPQDEKTSRLCRQIIGARTQAQGLKLLGWRPVPTDTANLGEKALSTCPEIWQIILASPSAMSGDEYERLLYLSRKDAENALAAAEIEDCYIASMSHRTIVYKGMLVAKQLREFYPDLQDDLFESSLAVVHQRYSTNTFPTWPLAQPFRMLAHNGEINTIQGNINWMRAREPEMHSQTWGADITTLRPIIKEGGSDSAMLDNVMEALVLSGRDPLHAVLMLVPEAWESGSSLDPRWRDFYEYHACLMEPWDGPAALAFSDGIRVGAALDRNGLRPLRYKIANDGLVIAGSEVGIVEVEEAQIVEKGRLGPGEMLVVDIARSRILKKDDVMADVVGRQPYGYWAQTNIRPLASTTKMANGHVPKSEPRGNLGRLQTAFGYSNEDLKIILKTMVSQGHDPVWSMGDDIPLPVLSEISRPIWFYFKQRFAQVTNPAIDSLREKLVMSLDCYIGPRSSLLEERPEHAKVIHLDSPVLTRTRMHALRTMDNPALGACDISCLFPITEGTDGLEAALDQVCDQAISLTEKGASILVLSDRGVDEEQAPVPMLLAVSAVHHRLIQAGKRMRVDLVAETGAAWDIHHIALLIGYGATAVYPYLALATAASLAADRAVQGRTTDEIEEDFRLVVERGLLKIMSKMGISTIRSYHGAQIFEIIGLNQELVNRHFTGTSARLGGIGLRELSEDILDWHLQAYKEFAEGQKLRDIGYIRFRKEGEHHAFNPEAVKLLQKAVENQDAQCYRQYTWLVNNGPPRALRDVLQFRSIEPQLSIGEIEPIENICRRFVTAAMSMGALSPNAHQTIAVGMNRLSARSNTGEGGEDRDWYEPFSNGDSANSSIKQIASGRFGVTTEYLSMAKEMEIKIAQGSKPGEGGQLPGHKVTEFISNVRHSTPGVPLISPPPHHDIYSIEDIAQLIYDLKEANPSAPVGVKLVAESGVGTIAAGVAKAYADYIQISGMDGGTGASPLSSIKNAGCPWELGLSETQQVLVMNGLRGRVRLRTDGGLKNGRDVVIAAMLGADEFGFGTASLVAIGCDMARQCHLNSCPTGIATQRQDLIERRFRGRPEWLVTYFTFVAQEVREILAQLGYRKLEDIIGRVDLLEPRKLPSHHRGRTLAVDAILANADPTGTAPRKQVQDRNVRPHPSFDESYLAKILPAIEQGKPVKLELPIRNSDLAAGARIAGRLAKFHRCDPLPDNTIEILYRGSAGQSFGAWCNQGMRLVLEGEANDYVGKGMSGGEIVIRPAHEAHYKASKNVIIGNTCLYGATGGRLFVAGRSGERFAVRNSGAIAVVEGTGDHCCEYMTQGVVVVLGRTGRNFGAGMSWGIAYVLDEDGGFPERYNAELVQLERVARSEDESFLISLIEQHVACTDSEYGLEILTQWKDYLGHFWKVVPLSKPMDVMGHAVQETKAKARIA